MVFNFSSCKCSPTGYGSPRTCGAARSPAEPKIPANEMELLRKVLPSGQSAVLQRVPAICNSVHITAHDKHTGAIIPKQRQREYLLVVAE